MPAVEYTKSFITSVVVGKDVVPRIGLHQMEALRADLINAIKRSVDPKWKTIACSMICCCCGPQPTSVVEMGSHDANVNVYEQVRLAYRLIYTYISVVQQIPLCRVSQSFSDTNELLSLILCVMI